MMSYSNEYLRNFRPVFLGILKARGICPARAELEVIDEESEQESIFEPADVRDVLEQLADDLNFLSIYTERPAYFQAFAERMYEENGLVVMLFSKRELAAGGMLCGGAVCGRAGRKRHTCRLLLDFEWEGGCYSARMRDGRCYIPIHKKPWKQGENLDIMVPIGYNTVIVKGLQNQGEKLGRDRFEEAFYSN